MKEFQQHSSVKAGFSASALLTLGPLIPGGGALPALRC